MVFILFFALEKGNIATKNIIWTPWQNIIVFNLT